MNTYRVRIRNTAGRTFTIEADTYTEAATKAVRIVNQGTVGRGRRIGVRRVSGDAGKGGIYQGFAPLSGTIGTAVGPEFSVI
jgi:hypothetical protein